MFTHVVCGGTFDHLHQGHIKLLDTCIKQGKTLTIGITSEHMTATKAYSGGLESYRKRRKNVTDYLRLVRRQARIIQLTNIFGSTLTDPSIDAVGVTEETVGGALVINKERKKRGMKPLSIIQVPFVNADDGERISSEHIRKGETNREGKSYKRVLFSREIHLLPNSLIRQLRMPLGRVFSSVEEGVQALTTQPASYSIHQLQKRSILVGDITTAEFKKRGLFPHFSVIDGSTQRQALNAPFLELIREKERSVAPNGKGSLQKDALNAVVRNFSLKPHEATRQVEITGEEDLLVLPLVLLTPLNWYIWYGMRDHGVVAVRVTEKKKEYVYNLIQRFR
jgi:pantetheine-phosphate adenylyltransferase